MMKATPRELAKEIANGVGAMMGWDFKAPLISIYH
jgi:hypothetical protein